MQLFEPAKGGSYEVFTHRLLDKTIEEYCARDVLLLPVLLQVYAHRLRGRQGLAMSLQVEGERRITLSQQVYYNGKGQHMAFGPRCLQWSSLGSSKIAFPMNLRHVTIVTSALLSWARGGRSSGK